MSGLKSAFASLVAGFVVGLFLTVSVQAQSTSQLRSAVSQELLSVGQD